jgi:outer membrane biogenesis lipoprotein LolB
MIKILKIGVLIIAFILVGCKSAKRVSANGNLSNDLTSEQLIKKHKKKGVNFETLQSKVKVEYIQGDRSQSHLINLRIQKDDVIWMSSALSIVRIKITPQKVRYYNKLDNTYFDGDFALISEFLGTELDFENVQNLLLGEALFDLDIEPYGADIHEESYVLFPKDQNALYEIFFLLNPSHFKMDSQQLSQPLKRRMLQIDYKNYQEVENQILPENIKVIALEENVETIVNMEFRSISLNNELRFPFRIPSGFDEIQIK